MQYNGIFYKKKTKIRNSIKENQQHYDRKIVQSFLTSSSSIMLKNGAASVISSSDTVGGGGAFIDGFYLIGGRSFKVGGGGGGVVIQSITVIRTCFSFWIFYVFQCHLFPIQIKLFVYLNNLSFKK